MWQLSATSLACWTATATALRALRLLARAVQHSTAETGLPHALGTIMQMGTVTFWKLSAEDSGFTFMVPQGRHGVCAQISISRGNTTRHLVTF